MSKTLNFFGTLSEASLDLANLLRPVANQAGFDFICSFPGDTTPLIYFEACLRSEVVVVDATIEQKVKNTHYANFNAMHITFDHIIIVSRTYLPLNFTTLFRDIAPSYPHCFSSDSHFTQDFDPVDESIWKIGNAGIIKQIVKRLPSINQPSLSTRLPEIGTVSSEEFYTTYTSLMEESMYRINAEHRNGKKKVFVSYRSEHLDKVKILIKKFEDEYEFTIFTPGTLAYEEEILTRLRRWQLMSILDRHIEHVDEFWIYDSNNYAESWWTQGELITLAYRKFSGSYCPEIKTLHSDKTPLLTYGYTHLPELTEKQVQQIARLYSNSDPLTMGPESINNIKFMQKISDTPIIGSIFHWAMEKIANSQEVEIILKKNIPISKISNGTISEREILAKYADREFMKEYLHDPIWDDSFGNNPVLEYGKQEAVNISIQVDAFINMTGLKYKEFAPSELEQCMKNHTHSHNGVNYTVEQAAPRYLWIANRMGKQEKSNLHVLDTIIFKKLD